MNWKQNIVKIVASFAVLFGLVLATPGFALASEMPAKPPQEPLLDSSVSKSALCYTCGGDFPTYVETIRPGTQQVVEFAGSCSGNSELRNDTIPHLCKKEQ